ncbi:MAG: HAMP domain-containing protein [Bacteroidetes bacterium]|nr:HAMP domain-containing protein [Bacteroidota bacterium]
MNRQLSWLRREQRWLYATAVLLVMLALVFAAREYFLRTVVSDWPALQRDVNEGQSRLITRRLNAQRDALLRQCASMMKDLPGGMRGLTGTNSVRARTEERLIERSGEEDYSFELRDGNGRLRAFGGEPILPRAIASPLPALTVLDRTPYLLLVATRAVQDSSGKHDGFLSVATPLGTNVPVSRRFLNSEGFLGALSSELELELNFTRERPAQLPAGRLLLPYTAERDTLGFISFEGIVRETWLAQVTAEFNRILLLLLLSLVIIISIPLFRIYASWPGLAASAIMVLHIWVIRFGMLFIGFAEGVVPASLLDPSYFASTFGWGLSSSPAELTLSVMALLLSAVAVYRVTTGQDQQRSHRVFLLLLIPVFVLLPFTLRGFAACIRSFVVDSTFNFDSIDSLLEEPMLLLMISNSYLLSLALGFGLLSMYLLVKRALGSVQHWMEKALWLLGGMLLSLGALVLTTHSLLLPLWAYALYAICFSIPVILRIPPVKGRSGTLLAPLMATVVFGSVLTIMFFGRSMDAKRYSEIEAIAIDFARPVDGWSQVLMEQTLQYVSRTTVPSLPRRGERETIDYEAAFRIWSGSPLSRLQNNSAILLLDSSGAPVSRFAVGNDPFLLSMHTLSATIARTEGIVQSADRQLETRERRYYRGYTDIVPRNHEKLVAVVILEALDPMEMTGQGIDLLRNAPAKLSSAPEDRFIISRFRGSHMVQTSDRTLERSIQLPAEVHAAFDDGNETVWSTLPVEGEQLQTYFMRLPEPGQEVLAITRGKSDALLGAYRALRIVVLYLFFSALIWVFAAIVTGRLGGWSRMTFARKLQLALLGVAAIPLLLIWVTGREFVLENTLDEIERQVSDDLDVLRSNILEQLPDSIPLSDLASQVNDQLCQEIRLRTGRDLNIYLGTELRATSKPELYHVGLLNNRLNPFAWLHIVQRGRDAWFDTEQIGDFSYQVGYRAIRGPDGTLAAVISTPTLFQREQIDEGYTRASATIFLWIIFIALLVLLASAALARQISRPLNELLRATRDITAGDLDRRVQVAGSAELVDLMDAFNTMTARLRRSQEELAAAERELAWKEMAKQVAHEIRNPLTPMKLAVQHLQRAWLDGAEHIGDIFDKVTRTLIDQIERLSRISDEFSRFGRMPRRSTARVDAGETLAETVSLFGSHAEVHFSLDIEANLPHVVADREELARAFTNLLRNAVQAIQERGTISISARRAAQTLCISITDDGSGIPPELLPRIFEPNFSTKTEGMGLGLAIVKKIIDDAGGDIVIESMPGEGTSVTITLPAA